MNLALWSPNPDVGTNPPLGTGRFHHRRLLCHGDQCISSSPHEPEVFFKNHSNWLPSLEQLPFLLTTIVGHSQTQYMIRTQPMKIAAAEALWQSEDPASFSLLTIGDEEAREDIFSIRVPGVLSLLAYNQFSGEVKGIRDLQAEYETKYGPGNYVPSVFTAYWTFRGMVGAGTLMVLLAFYALLVAFNKKPILEQKMLSLFPFFIALPYLANTTGWLLTETGRQPWAVFGVLKTADAISPTVTVGLVLTSLIVFTLLYGGLMAADVYLLVKFAKAGPLARRKKPQLRQNLMKPSGDRR